MNNHTPGPWRPERREPFVGNGKVSWYVDAQHTTVARVSTPSRHAEANARLIAAAPELLTACVAALAHHQGGHSEIGQALRAAIDKAEGHLTSLPGS